MIMGLERGGIRGFLYRFFLRISRSLERGFGDPPPSSIQTTSPANGATGVALSPNVSGTCSPENATVDGCVFVYTSRVNADHAVTAQQGSWTLHFSNLTANTQYTLKTFIVSTMDPASCVTTFTTGAS
jgi:hypothetical protein